MKDRLLPLRWRCTAEHFARGRLIEAAFYSRKPHGLQQSQCACCYNVGSKLRHIKADLNVTLRTQVVHFIGFEIMQQRGERTAIRKVGVVQKEPGAGLVKISEDMIDAISVEA